MISKTVATLLIFTQISIISIYSNPSCHKSWATFGTRCYRLVSSPRNYEGAKAKCNDLMSQLALVEQESNKANGQTIHLIEYLKYLEQNRSELLTRQYYVSLGQELHKQYQERLNAGLFRDPPNDDALERLDPDAPMSDLWLPHHDTSSINSSASRQDSTNEKPVIVLGYSKDYKRWGLFPVPPNRKKSFICEIRPNSPNQPEQNTQIGQQQTNEARQVSSQQNQNRQLPETQKFVEKSLIATTNSQPETSVLFREHPQDISVVLGSTAEMRCNPMDQESSIIWLFNGRNLTQSKSRFKIFDNGTLRIDHVRNNDDGNYTCTINSGGSSESKSARLEIIELPHQPEYISAELLDKLSTSVRVNWTPGFNGNTPITKYSVEMRTVTSDNIEAELNSNSWELARANISADQTSVILSDLKPAKKYIFRVTATNKIGTGSPSLPTKNPVEVPGQLPSMAPENLSGTARSSFSILIQWSPPPIDSQNGIIKGYKVRHKLAGYATDTPWYTNDVTDIAHLNFVLDDLIAWKNYEIQVAAENDRGVGPFSPSIVVRTKEGIPDRAPRDVSAKAMSSMSIKVSWNPPPPQNLNGLNQGYKVQIWNDLQQTQLAKEVSVVNDIASHTQSALINDLTPYTEYFISVKCYTNAGEGPPNEDIVRVKTKSDLPEAVESIEFADVLDRSLRVIWKPPKRINGELDHYTLEYSETSNLDQRKSTKNYPANTNEARIVDLTPQTSYTFRIYPHTNSGQGPKKSNTTTTSVPPVLPEPPSNLFHYDIEPFSVSIRFDPGFDGNAKIEKWIAEALSPSNSDSAPRWHQIYVSSNHTSSFNTVVVRNLRPFTRYKIRLTPVNIVGPSKFPSEPTQEFQTNQIEPEQPPRDLTIEEVKPTSVIARWTPLANNQWFGVPKGYNLTWYESNNSSILHYLINDTRAESCLIRDLEEFTEYIFKISAVNEVGSSVSSEQVIVTTLEDVPSSGPANLTAHPLSSNTISVDWNNVPRRHRNGIIRGYKIQYQAVKADASIQYKLIDDNSTKHITLNDLKPYTLYNLAIAAYTAAGDGVYSSVLSVKTLENTPGAPQNLTFSSVSQTDARILWDPPEDPNGEILSYKVTYQIHQSQADNANKEINSHDLHPNERTFKANNLKAYTNYVFTITAKTKEGWGLPASAPLYTSDSELRANLPFHKEVWFVVLCACASVMLTIIVTAILFIETKGYRYKQDAIKSASQDRLGDTGFTIDDEPSGHYNNIASSNRGTNRYETNLTLPKSPPRPQQSSVVYSDEEGDDDVFEEEVAKQPPTKSIASTSKYDSSGDSLTEKPSEISSTTGPESESADEDYVNMANKHFVNHYAIVNGTLRGQRQWRNHNSHRTKPKLPQRPAPFIPQLPVESNSSSSENNNKNHDNNSISNGVSSSNNNNPKPGPSGIQDSHHKPMSVYSNEASSSRAPDIMMPPSQSEHPKVDEQNNQNQDLLNCHMANLNGGRIIVNNMAGSRAPLPGFTSFV